MSTVYTDKVLYDTDGYSGKVYYVVVIEKNTAKAWNYVTQAMEVDPARIQCALICPEVPGEGRYKINLPTNLPVGIVYDVVIYEQAGAIPDPADNVKDTYTIQVGSIFGF